MIKPSDLSLYNKLHIICYMKNKNNSILINSLANIIKNEKFQCIEYFNINEKINFGIKIYFENKENVVINLFNTNLIKYEQKYINNDKFDPLLIYKNYINENKSIYIHPLNIKKFFINKPKCSSKFKILSIYNKWYFNNIYNNYFCFCKGSCLFVSQLCKYHFYLSIIDNNKFLYNKTEYLFSDFYFGSSDDTFPVFKEMIKRNISAHYMDENIDIYNQFCNKEKHCLKILPVINKKIFIDGDFLENYLELILKLKAVIVCHEFISIYNIFYNIEYISYINLGHGVKYFKHFSYNEYSSFKKYNKLVLPPSNKIISLAKKYGWNETNIIKNCLPKWDKYNNYKLKIKSNEKFGNITKSIFIMFTWRYLLNWKISSVYVKNIITLINDDYLNKVLEKNNITLYFGLHHNFRRFKKKIKVNKMIKYVNQKDISDCLMNSSLLISDFSSIIFDMIYQNKPVIIFIPDAFDNKIKYLYQPGYYEIIKSFKNGSIYFTNKFFYINDTIKKTIYYIKNNFKLEKSVKTFYDSFQLNCINNTNKFINYLVNDL